MKTVDYLIEVIRKLIRPVWSVVVIIFDFYYFNPSSKSEFSQGQEDLLFWLNIFILIFWFGEKAIKNAMPAFESFMAVRNGQKDNPQK